MSLRVKHVRFSREEIVFELAAQCSLCRRQFLGEKVIYYCHNSHQASDKAKLPQKLIVLLLCVSL